MKIRGITWGAGLLCASAIGANGSLSTPVTSQEGSGEMVEMTVYKSETGEEFDVEVPEGLRAYEYNGEWIDSMPYLVDRARYGEPWAYEALGDCYRMGKNGVEQSAFMALGYYILAQEDVDKLANKLGKENSRDYFYLSWRLMDRMDCYDREGMLDRIEELNKEGHHGADVLKMFSKEVPDENTLEKAQSIILDPDAGTDETVFALSALMLSETVRESLDNHGDLLDALTVKMPFLAEVAVSKMVQMDREENRDPDIVAHNLQKTISVLTAADKVGMLNRTGARILYDHYKTEIEAGRMTVEPEEMERLATIGKIRIK